MPQWIDTQADGVALLARNTSGGAKELVLRRLRPDAVVPAAAVAYGFQPEGEIFVRKDTRFSLAEIRQIFPAAQVAEMALEDIVYRVAAPIARLAVPNLQSSARPAQEPATAADHVNPDTAAPPASWAHVPRARFLMGARELVEGGAPVVEFEGSSYASGDSPKAIHRHAVQAAQNAGESLPFAVLVDYPEMAYFGATKRHAPTRVAKLLSTLEITERLMDGERGHAVLKNDGYEDLVIVREARADGQRLTLTHYYEKHGQVTLDAELVFHIRGGQLHLSETAVDNVLRGGEIRGHDAFLANRLSKNWLDQGFALAEVQWPDQPAPIVKRSAPEPPVVPADVGAPSVATVAAGPAAGMAMAFVFDHQGAAKLAVGMSQGAALGNLLAETASPAATNTPRARVGQNMFGMSLLEDTNGVRYLDLRTEELPEDLSDRGLEFMTVSEAKRAGKLTLAQKEPTKGVVLFGRPVYRSLKLSDGSAAYFSVEKGSSGESYAYRLDFANGGRPTWLSLGAAWTHGAPSDGELLSSRTRPVEGFDERAFVEAINQAIESSTQEVLNERYRILPLDPDKITVRKVSEQAYEVTSTEEWVPLGHVRVEQNGDHWRASHGTSSSSLRCSLEAACSWASRTIATHREYYLAHLHQATDGSLQFAVPEQDFNVLRRVLHKASIGEQTSWQSMGVQGEWKVDPKHLRAEVAGEGRLRIEVRGRDLAYEVCAMEADPASTFAHYQTESLRRIGQWLSQVQDDIHWDETVKAHPDGALLQRRMREYQDLQVKHYGAERFGTRVPSARAREMILAITDRDVDRLISVIGDNGPNNKSTMRLFQSISGLNPGHSRATRAEAVYRFCGYSADQAAQHARGRDDLARVRAMEREAKSRIDAVANMMVKHNGTEKSGKAMIDDVWAQGYTELTTRRQGAATRYMLRNPGTGQYYDLKEPLTGYARHLVTIRDSANAAPAPADEPEDSPTPGY
ncbi:hypothetical protein [Xanthomonas hortorum]|uniref:hypothetical protein n=2 Tax=Xanthomonas hortorum TaxID=56454 RepID=UPI0032E8A530